MNFNVTYNDRGEIRNVVITAVNEQEAGKLFSKLHPSIALDQLISVRNAADIASIQKTRLLYGLAFGIAGVLIVLFAHSHKPPENWAEAANALIRGTEWVLKPEFYYALMALGIVLIFVGATRILKYVKEPRPPGG